MPHRTLTWWIDKPHNTMRLTAELVGERERVVWALKQLVADLESGRAPRSKEPSSVYDE